MTSKMSRADEARIAKLINSRHKLVRLQIDQKAADMLSQAEEDLSAAYVPSDHPEWLEAISEAQAAIEAAKTKVAKVAEELNIPEAMRPDIRVSWDPGGNAYMAEKQKVAARKIAAKRIEAMRKEAMAAAEMQQLDATTKLLSGQFDSQEAGAFLDSLPPAPELLPNVLVNTEALLSFDPYGRVKDGSLPNLLLIDVQREAEQ
jgi:hypothetical protein